MKNLSLLMFGSLLLASQSAFAKLKIEGVPQYCQENIIAERGESLHRKDSQTSFTTTEGMIQFYDGGGSLRSLLPKRRISTWDLSQIPKIEVRKDAYFGKLDHVLKILGVDPASGDDAANLEKFLSILTDHPVQTDPIEKYKDWIHVDEHGDYVTGNKAYNVSEYNPDKAIQNDREILGNLLNANESAIEDNLAYILENRKISDEKYANAHAMIDKTKVANACRFYNIMGKKNCTLGLGMIMVFMGNGENGVTGLHLIKSVLLNESLSGALRTAALKINRRVKDYLASSGAGVADAPHLFQDIKDSFLSSGFNDADAEAKAWDVLGMLSMRSTNMEVVLPLVQSSEQVYNYASLSMIAGSIAVLDFVTTPSGHPYSMPATVETQCQYGKFYHFWASAYLSHYLNQILPNYKANPKHAEKAAMISEIGYQFDTNFGERDKNRTYTEKENEPGNNKIRIDLSFAAAGAVFGSTETELKVDHSIASIFNAEGKGSDLAKALLRMFAKLFFKSEGDFASESYSNGTLTRLLDWNRFFSPMTALDSLD